MSLTEFSISPKISVGGSNPLLVIAGPCVIESAEVCDEIASTVQSICRDLSLNYIFKASFDKANRTSIDSFRGPGM